MNSLNQEMLHNLLHVLPEIMWCGFGVILMLLLTLASQRFVIPRMAELRGQMGSVEATPASDPRRAEFDRLHGISVDLEGGVLVIGLVALYLTVRASREGSNQ